MATQPKDLVIDGWQAGIADSDFAGFGDMANVDISTIPNAVIINNPTEKETDTTILGVPYFFAYNPSNQIMYMIDDGGKVYSAANPFTNWSQVVGNVTGDSNNGLAVWNDYVFAFRSSQVDVYGPLSGAPSWTNAWQSYSSGGWKPTINSMDGKLYWGSRRWVSSLEELTTFDPATPGTYDYINQALDLPENYVISCFEELGGNLMIGTYKGAVAYAGSKVADIFPWDKVSPSFQEPIRIADFGIRAMINIRDVLYFLAGNQGSLYATNGSTTVLLRELYKPMQHMSPLQDTWGFVLVHAVSAPFSQALMSHRNKLYIAVSGSPIAFNGGIGVWSMDLDTRALNFENQLSTGDRSPTSVTYICCLFSVGNLGYIIGWDASNSGEGRGVDLVLSSNRYTNYAATIDSPMYIVGTVLQKKEFTQGEFILGKKLSTGQGVKVAYRLDQNDGWTEIGTFDFATLGNINSHNFIPQVPACEKVQFRFYLTAAATGLATPVLRSFTFR